MFMDGQRIERHEVEPALAAANPFLSHFLARVTEHEEGNRIRVRIEVLGPNNEPLMVAKERTAGYWSLKGGAALPQTEGFAA